MAAKKTPGWLILVPAAVGVVASAIWGMVKK